MSKWQNKILSEICGIVAGGDVPKGNFSKEKTAEFQIPIFSNGIGKDALYGYTNVPKINPPCITVAARGSIGYCAFREEPFYPIIRLICIKSKDEKLTNIKYIYYFLQNTRIKGSESGIPQLTIPMISKYKILLPDLETQGKIVVILEKWDAAIENLKQQITEEEKLLKGLFQKIFFQSLKVVNPLNEWQKIELGKVAIIKKGTQLGRLDMEDDGKFFVINGGMEPSGCTNNSNMPADTITISEGGNSCGYVKYIKNDFWLGGHCYAIANMCVDKKFLYFALKANERKIMSLRVGSGLPNIQKEALESFKIGVPSSEKQKTIAKVLDIQEQKISLLRQKLSNYEQQRKYLLNRLLSGKEDI